MNIGILTDSYKFPNLALMKISAYYKKLGHNVDWFIPALNMTYDKVFYSKIFAFTKEETAYMPNVEMGGTGFDIYEKLPDEIDNIYPDYSIYPACDYAVCFITRGCIRDCRWCVVPKKEGTIKPYKKVEEIARKDTNKIIFLDNNILASSFGLSEVEYLAGSDYRVDFNQGLDARLVDDNIAKLLVKVKWLRYIRFSCDTKAMLDVVLNAVERLRKYGYKKEVFVYVLGIDAADTLYRLNELKKYNLVPFMQPYRDGNKPVSSELKRIARWCNKRWIFKSCDYDDYNDNKKATPINYIDELLCGRLYET